MAATNLIAQGQPTDWFYDAEADVLYISFGKPRAAVSEDVGEGVIVRYDEQTGQVVGVTLLGLRARLEREQNAAG
ncbi:MAG: DUF2283 domain-containing protein [Fimbriimonadales bacterium]|nr:DUF2283 domain-containing protein [Fimbriimonadales bacterium]MCS7301598.1 DUF2283 domain-containing protein [Fimbriimonadales bacterium]